MVAVAILSMGLIFVLQGLTKCLGVLNTARCSLEAGLLAEEKMAEAEISFRNEKGSAFTGLSGQSEAGNVEFSWQVGLESDAEYDNLYLVRDIVRWREGKRNGITPLVTYFMSVNVK
ncbi:MAG: hypothetical protein PHO34_05400, partial [Candidatus Omnitrophica bacterium]|nr:hypothetical protein [Candidatus Omnitrophota bacterium]